ncbi:hypothetical protein GCM10023212_30070 [Luteolibacter yonseiensis]|uniref:hypothetical protein n=1 Tax=Luteolibacter yonseiensis TaxID=1144680 RepID=UPI0031E9E13A
MRTAIAAILSLTLVMSLVNATVALASDSLVVFLGNHSLVGALPWVALPTLLMTFAVYGLMLLTPMIPKRWFIPLTLCGPVTALAALPLMIYFHTQAPWIAFGISVVQMVVCLVVLRKMRGSWSIRWPLFNVDQLGDRGFRWGHTAGFATVNLLVLLPATVAYLVVCGGLALNHYTGGFVSLRPEGMTMQARKYIRDDGKTVELVPMSHIGDSDFYQSLTASFSPTAVILMEGVSDKDKLFANKVGYKKTAQDLGLSEQQEFFKPKGELVAADVDISQFSKASLEYLKKTMTIHAKGVTPETLPLLMQPAPEDLPKRLIDDLLTLRNRHLLEVMEERLKTSDHIIIPWGAAHMPGISEGVLKAGFRVQDTEDFVAIRFSGRKTAGGG